jgi:dCMP deaminase
MKEKMPICMEAAGKILKCLNQTVYKIKMEHVCRKIQERHDDERGGKDMGDKRQGYISWDEYFMGVAMLAGMRSKDPNSQVGACIVSEDNKILSMGYNGFPKGCSDDEFPWSREGEALDTKYVYVVHSELNAILNYRGGSLEGAKLYVSLFPCNECAKAIIQAGIKTIVYDNDKYHNTPATIASRRMLDAAGVRYYQYQRTGRKIEITV